MEVLARYKRKAVPNPLEIRGISQNTTDALIQPSPDELPPAGSLPRDFTDHVQEAISSYSPEPVRNVRMRAAAMTSQPSAVPEEARSLSLSDTWTTGVGAGSSTERMTDDRSSTSSAMSYDDFDHEASMKVRLLFEEIDAVLFESVELVRAGDDSGGHRPDDASEHNINTECRQWNAVFPHLRILGKQLLDTKDMGYQSISSPVSSSLSNSFTLPSDSGSSGSHLEDVTDQDLHDAQSLSVEGRRVAPKTLDKCCPPGCTFDTVRHLEEEVFVQDGSYEDIIAIDHDAQDEAIDSRKLHVVHRRRRSRYPPVTPNACVKDDVCNAVFDVIWASANGAMRVLLQQYADSFVVPSLQHRSHHGGGVGARGRDGVGKPLGGAANDGAFRFPMLVSQPPSRADFAHLSNRPLGSLFAASGSVVRHPHLTGNNMSATPGSSHTPSAAVTALETIKLDNILTISKKEMQAREKTFSDEPSSGTPTASMSWPGGSLLKKAPAAAIAGILHRNMSATVKKATAGRGRLAPLNDRVRTPTVEEDVPRAVGGHGLQGLHMAGKRISSPPMAAASSGMRTLPPIMQSEQFDAAAVASLSQRMQKRSSRATSAVAEKDGRTPRDRMINPRDLPETRPSTTHTAFRADTPNNNVASSGNRQSSTPIGMAAHFRGDGTNVFLGITGSSLTGGGASRDMAAVAAGESSLLSPAALAEQLRQRTIYDDADLDEDDFDDEHYDDFARQHFHHGHQHQQHWGTPHAASGYGTAAAAGYRHRGGKTVSSLAR